MWSRALQSLNESLRAELGGVVRRVRFTLSVGSCCFLESQAGSPAL